MGYSFCSIDRCCYNVVNTLFYSAWRLMKIRDVLKRLEDDGWYISRTKGSHRQYKHPNKKGLVTVAGHPSDDLHPKTLNSIWEQAQLEESK